jgi:YHS domain-containing protein
MGSILLDLLEFVILLLFLKMMARSLGSIFSSSRIHIRTAGGGPSATPTSSPHQGETARDPVCGMFVSTELSRQLKHGAETLHFCSRECMEKYQKGDEHVAS